MKSFLLVLLLSVAGLLNAQDFAVGDLYYYVNDDEVTVSVAGHVDDINATGALIIPETVTYSGMTFSVTAIGADAFRECSGLTSVTFPNSLTTIGNVAFSGCTGITSFTIPNSVTYIEAGAFYETGWYNNQPDGILNKDHCCLGYKGGQPTGALQIPEGTRLIAGGAFYNCSGLTSLTLPNSLNTIGDEAFTLCSGLSSLTLPNSLTYIGEYAFSECTHINSFNIPNTVTYVGWRAFYETGWYNNQPDGVLFKDNCCIDYKGDDPTGDLHITEGTRLIADFAFGACFELTSLSLPGSLEIIQSRAFEHSSHIASIETKATTPPTLGASVFSEFMNFAIPVTIPDGTMTAYQNAPGWNRFTNFMEVSGQNISEIRVEGYTAPVWGAHPDFEMELAAGIHCTIDEISWLWRTDYDDEELTSNSVFNRDYGVYYMSISFLPAEGYHFDDDVQVYFNNQASIYNPEYSGTVGPVYYAYTIDYQLSEPGALNYGFEDGTPQGCATLDADGDGYGWYLYPDNVNHSGHNGSAGMISSESWHDEQVLTPDNYFVLPQVKLGGRISFWARAQDENYPAEHFGVAVSTIGNANATSFTTIQEWTITAKATDWLEYSVDLSAYDGQAGYVAIRHFGCTDQFILNVDDIKIIEGGDLPVIPTYTLSVTCDPAQGIVRGSGTYEAGAIVTVTAIPNAGYSFDRWNDGVTDNPRAVTVSSDMSLEAYFKQTGVNETDENALNVYPNPTRENLRIEGLEANATVEIYNSLGMMVKSVIASADEEINVSDLPQGIYMLRCGRQTIRFVKE